MIVSTLQYCKEKRVLEFCLKNYQKTVAIYGAGSSRGYFTSSPNTSYSEGLSFFWGGVKLGFELGVGVMFYFILIQPFCSGQAIVVLGGCSADATNVSNGSKSGVL